MTLPPRTKSPQRLDSPRALSEPAAIARSCAGRRSSAGRDTMRNTITDRRNFLLGAAAVAGAGYLAGTWGGRSASAAQAPVGRKQVMVAGKRVKVIDIHGHMVVPKSGELLQGSGVKGEYPMAQIMGPERF